MSAPSNKDSENNVCVRFDNLMLIQSLTVMHHVWCGGACILSIVLGIEHTTNFQCFFFFCNLRKHIKKFECESV